MCLQFLQNSHNMKKKNKKKKISKLKLIIIIGAIIYVCYGLWVSYARAMAIQNEKQALEARIRLVESMEIPELIKYLAPENATTLGKIAWCESSNRMDIIHYNDGSKGSHSYYLFQFKIGTWEHFTKMMGEDLNIESAYDQIRVADYMVSHGYAYHWSCAKITKVI